MSRVNSTISNFSERFLTANISTLEEQIGQEKKFFVFLNFFYNETLFLIALYDLENSSNISFNKYNISESASELILIIDSLKSIALKK